MNQFAYIADRVRDETREVLRTPAGITQSRRVLAVMANVVLNAYGHLELVPAFSFLSRYPVTSYVYEIAPGLSRGERPRAAKVIALRTQGYGATVNLCAETPGGDARTIAAAGLTGEIETHHHPITDMNPPSIEQMVSVLDTLVGLRNRGVRTYLSCQAGRLRAGVVTACYRMAVMGWSVSDALTEAKNFGNFVPMQQAFIEDFGVLLSQRFAARQSGAPDRHPELGSYPLCRPGSIEAKHPQLAATVKSAVLVSRL